jgi:hypothetical protein
MKITTKEDINAPIDFVFAQITDFASFERQALRRGADVKRLDTLAEPGVGMSWQAAFLVRNKQRSFAIQVVDMAAPGHLKAETQTAGLEGMLLVDLLALSRNQTRLTLSVELKPVTLTTRLWVQSLKLARGRVTGRLQTRITAFADEIEERHRRQSGVVAGR